MSVTIINPSARRAVAACLAVALLSGCAGWQRDSITVGAVPDDYRTNHPIVVGERTRSIDIPVGASQHSVSQTQTVALRGFLHDYDKSSRPVVTMLVPHGSANQHSAAIVANELSRVMQAEGIGSGHILQQAYHAEGAAEAPIRVRYAALAAYTGQCGRWDADLLDNPDNRHYTNFGCASQNNLAAQVANPADLLGPRQRTPIDAENRSNAIDQYRDRAVAADVRANREINY
jgi:pilus assembly protein CpaD